MSSRARALVVAVGAALLLAIPASASAVTATFNQACYSHVPTKGSQPVVITLAGGTPGGNFLIAATVPGKGLGSAGSVEGTFDAAGNGTAQLTDVFPPSGSIEPIRGQAIQLSVTDYGPGTGVDSQLGQTLITNIALSVSSKPRNPHAKRRVKVSGTPFAGRKVYGFVVRGSSSHVLRRVALGTGDVCGYTSAKTVVAPRGFRAGSYRFYVNAGRKLDKAKALRSSFTISRRAF